ncbi:MAG: hypothetical protein DDG60_02745 [Anaerolineae bacterium]|nr:MAG: hypothetical protein DDG60_02745 [Anaerolineae bacterium]
MALVVLAEDRALFSAASNSLRLARLVAAEVEVVGRGAPQYGQAPWALSMEAPHWGQLFWLMFFPFVFGFSHL